MADMNIINELLSLEHFALTVEANARSLRQKATRLRKQLGGDPSAVLNGGLTVEQSNKLIAGRMKNIVKKQKIA